MTTAETLQQEQHRSDVEATPSGRCYRPSVDILETSDELVLFADMPGARGEDVDVHFEDGQLTVRATIKERQSDKARYDLREYGVGDFYHTFRVNEQIDASRIAAQYADGVLKLHMPKVEAAKPRKIVVKS